VGQTVGQAMASAIVTQWNTANPKNPITLTPKKNVITDPTNVGKTSGDGKVVHADYETYATQRDSDYGSLVGDWTLSDLKNHNINPSEYMRYAYENDYTGISSEKYEEAIKRDGFSAT